MHGTAAETKGASVWPLDICLQNLTFSIKLKSILHLLFNGQSKYHDNTHYLYWHRQASFTSVLCCVRFCAPCFVTECSLLVISLFFSPLCLLKLLSKMCVCFPHINLTCFQIKFCKICMSVSEPVTVRAVFCQVYKVFIRAKTSVSS